MDWNRAKNIIIGLLCVLNIFLLGNYLYARYAQAGDTQTQAELELYLESRGVSLSCQLPRMQTPARGVSVAENTQKLADRTLSALLGADVQWENGEAVSQTGLFSWVAGVLEGELSALPDGEEADLEDVIRLLDSVGIVAGRIERQKASATLYKDFGDPAQPVYNIWIQIDRLENGNWGISGRWFLGEPESAGGGSERDIAGLLVTFTDALLTQDTALHTISGIEAGWTVSVLTNVGVKLTPVFQITTNAGNYYINAIDAQLLNIG